MEGTSGFDYIVVGAGSSGCVLAYRLSEDPRNSVLLIESGPPDKHPLITMPRGYASIIFKNPEYTFQYSAKNSKTGGSEPWARGRTLGGSSSLNGLAYVRGFPWDFNDWKLPGWGWSNILMSYKAIERHEAGDSEWHGGSGPLRVSFHPEKDELCEAFFGGCEENGITHVHDLNTATNEATGYLQRTIWKGRRQSSAVAFLHPVRHRPNLEVLTKSSVLKILFEGKRASGIVVRREGQVQIIQARGEIILTAGAIESPKLLQLSGIGPGGLLQKHNIPVIAESPDVGENMREHRVLLAQFKVRRGSHNHLYRLPWIFKTAAEYFLFRKGGFSRALAEVGGYIKSRPDIDRPDGQLLFGLLARNEEDVSSLLPDTEPSISCGGYVMRPESRGHVRISSPDPDAAPEIDPNSLSTEYDQRISVAIISRVKAILASASMAPYDPVQKHPKTPLDTEGDIINAFHNNGYAMLHATSTCRMGTDATSVLDERMRVRGVSGLRVADISIMPTQVSGNTNAPAMAMAWRAADLILER